jgi:hypothetical protein
LRAREDLQNEVFNLRAELAQTRRDLKHYKEICAEYARRLQERDRVSLEEWEPTQTDNKQETP